ncbi:uncharacterized protein RSE6_05128 [Rhynchosporium secalis]|uniref:Uncharacterized protein n=1 Tax=Rhynchosporium secalis TaxID=38038 RepID=A0A1E1M878_RHYSE|nr:uncharacterized protein RSE6_05128 [Rhynchosporium secalis]
MSASNLDLLRKITPNAILDQEIASTISAVGTGNRFTDRQAMLLLRLSLKERNKRARDIWDDKGRARKVRKSWYEGLSEQQLGTVGLSLGLASDTENRSRRYGDAKMSASNDKHNDEVDPDETRDEGEDASNRAEDDTLNKKDGKKRKYTEMARIVFPRRSKESGTLKMSVGWLHDMDRLTSKIHAGKITYCNCRPAGNNMDSESEVDHFVDILLDMKTLTLGRLLSQLDDALIDSIPDAKWGNLTLCAIEISRWIGSDIFKATLQERFGAKMTKEQVEKASADLGFMQVFVGYEYVSKGVAQATRLSLRAE